MKSKLPKTVFIRYDGEGDDRFLNVTESLNDHAEMGVSHRVGKYQLVEQMDVSAKEQITVVPKK